MLRRRETRSSGSGVGFNTPAIIRWPFELITAQHPNTTLGRVNLDDVRVPGEIAAESVAFQQDIAEMMQALLDRDPEIRTCLSGRSPLSQFQPPLSTNNST
jgi:hypothetical protein